MQAEVLLPGPGITAECLVLTAPISFWGGVDPKTGKIADPRHPEHDVEIAHKVVMIPDTVGSSSASAVLLELVHANRAPAAIVLHQPDAILLLGLVVAREMGLATPMALRLDRSRFGAFDSRSVTVTVTGEISSQAD